MAIEAGDTGLTQGRADKRASDGDCLLGVARFHQRRVDLHDWIDEVRRMEIIYQTRISGQS